MSVGEGEAGGTGAFGAERAQLFGLAYRMLGSAADAEDVVQDVWLRWQAADRSAIVRPGAWLTTVTTRLAIDRIRAQQRRREAYVGPWVPEPVAVDAGPEELAELSDTLTMGFLTFLDTLPAEDRAVYLLAEVFSRPYAEVATTVGRSEEACRQVVSRSRRKLRRAAPRAATAAARQEADAAVTELLTAIAAGDVPAALARVAPDAVLVSDGGPQRRAARHPVLGADRIVRLLANLYQRLGPEEITVEAARINEAPGLLLSLDGQLDSAMVFDVTGGGRVAQIWIIRNPDKLRHLAAPLRFV